MNQQQEIVLKLAAAVVISLAPGDANAGFFKNTDGLSSPTTTVTFSEVPLTEPTTVSTEFAGYGVEFASLVFEDDFGSGFGSAGSYSNITGESLLGFGLPDGSGFSFSIYFIDDLTEAAFAMASASPVTASFEAFLDGASTGESGTAPSGPGVTENYFGFSGIVFDEIRINGLSPWAAIDNIELGESYSGGGGSAVPEPSTLATWTVLGALALFASRRRRTAVAE